MILRCWLFILPPEELKDYVEGAIVTYPGYTSTSLSYGFGRIQNFVIRSKTGRYIAPYTRSYYEYEVLFPAGTKFKVIKRDEDGPYTHIVMEEVE